MKTTFHLGRKIKHLNNAFEYSLNQSLSSQGLTTSQSFFLGHLHYKEKVEKVPVYAKDIAASFNLKYSTVSGILSRLETNGFIVYVADPADKRLKRIALTDKAISCHEETVRKFENLEKRMLEGFSDEESKIFSQLLEKAANNIGMFCMPEFQKGDD